MSQRLCIGLTDKTHYDCVLTTPEKAIEKLLSEWLCLSPDGWFLSPWKVNITDEQLFNELEPILEQIVEGLGKEYPEDITFFKDDEPFQPTKTNRN